MKPVGILVVGTALATLLAGCGGGLSLTFGDFDDGDLRDNVPYASNLAASVTVAGASEVQVNGTYASSDTLLNKVWRFFASGSAPETCRFRFAGLQQQAGSGRAMSGDIWYLPESSTVSLAAIAIDGQDFELQDTRAAVADRAENRVTLQGAVFRSREFVETITVDGSIPIRPEFKDPGC